mmetsp:Transcript_27567/g.59351  ORF Transcript_27567/g.59351 Transcript_27567/m.59351 type:complete len:98 (+) Transcript_27567:1842-2135(+)
MCFSGLLHLPQDERTRLRRRVLLALDLHPRVAIVGTDDAVWYIRYVLLDVWVLEAAADEPLRREDCAGWVCHRLTLGRCADQTLPIVREADDGRRCA